MCHFQHQHHRHHLHWHHLTLTSHFQAQLSVIAVERFSSQCVLPVVLSSPGCRDPSLRIHGTELANVFPSGPKVAHGTR